MLLGWSQFDGVDTYSSLCCSQTEAVLIVRGPSPSLGSERSTNSGFEAKGTNMVAAAASAVRLSPAGRWPPLHTTCYTCLYVCKDQKIAWSGLRQDGSDASTRRSVTYDHSAQSAAL